jgi:hypothetical protein
MNQQLKFVFLNSLLETASEISPPYYSLRVDYKNTAIVIIIQFLFIYVLTQQPNGQLQS